MAWQGVGGSFRAVETFPGYNGSALAFDRYGNAGLTLVRDGADGLQHISIAWRRPGDSSFRAPREVAVTRGADYAKLLFIETGAMLVWSGRDVDRQQGLSHIYASFGSVDGRFSAPAIISDPSLDGDRGVTGRLLAESNARGDVIVAWASGINGSAIDVATRRVGHPFVASRFQPTLARPAGGVSPSGTFLVGWANPFDPIEVHRDDSGRGGFQKVALPPRLTTGDAPVMGIDALEDLQILVATGAGYDHLGTHSVLSDGTVGAFDEIVTTRRKNTNPYGVLRFDGQGHGWAVFDDSANGGSQVYVSRYDARRASAVRAPSISAVRYRRAPAKRTRTRTSAAPRGPAVSLTLSKTARVKLSARCVRQTKGRRCHLRKTSWKVRAQMGANRVLVPGGVRRRLKHGARYRLILTARDSLGKLSRSKSITFGR